MLIFIFESLFALTSMVFENFCIFRGISGIKIVLLIFHYRFMHRVLLLCNGIVVLDLLELGVRFNRKLSSSLFSFVFNIILGWFLFHFWWLLWLSLFRSCSEVLGLLVEVYLFIFFFQLLKSKQRGSIYIFFLSLGEISSIFQGRQSHRSVNLSYSCSISPWPFTPNILWWLITNSDFVLQNRKFLQLSWSHVIVGSGIRQISLFYATKWFQMKRR